MQLLKAFLASWCPFYEGESWRGGKVLWVNNGRGCNLKPIRERRYFYWNVLSLSFPAPPIDRRAKYNSSGKHHSIEIFLSLFFFFIHKLKTLCFGFFSVTVAFNWPRCACDWECLQSGSQKHIIALWAGVSSSFYRLQFLLVSLCCSHTTENRNL